MSDLLDDNALANPVWSCLSTRHAHLARGGALARRYPSDFSPLCGMPDAAQGNIEALHALVEVGDDVAVAGPHVPDLPANWETLHRIRVAQMILSDTALLKVGDIDVCALAAADVDDMLALVELTRPGPFRRRTVELGGFLGVREQGRLVAMAGERMWIGDHREVSGICTHPEAQGRGLARALTGRVINRMLRAGQTPILHVEAGNERAIAMYHGLGFVRLREFPLLFATRTR